MLETTHSQTYPTLPNYLLPKISVKYLTKNTSTLQATSEIYLNPYTQLLNDAQESGTLYSLSAADIDGIYDGFISTFHFLTLKILGMRPHQKYPHQNQSLKSFLRNETERVKVTDETLREITTQWMTRHDYPLNHPQSGPLRTISIEHPLYHFGLAQIRKKILSYGSSKSPGPDHIPIKVWKICIAPVSRFLETFYRTCLSRGHTPSAWNTSTTVFLLKKGKNHNRPESWRPIGLTSFPRRLFQMCLMDHVDTRFNIQGLFHNAQHGFRKGRDTHTAAHVLNTHLEQNDTSPILFDIAMAYDSVSRRALLGCLRDKIDRDNIFYCIKSMLDPGSTQTLLTNGDLVIPIRTCQGTIQGDPLSPWLFNCIMDRIITQIPVRCKSVSLIVAYADDLAICAPPTDIPHVSDSLVEILQPFGLRLATEKTIWITYDTSGFIPCMKHKATPYLGFMFGPTGFNPRLHVTRLCNSIPPLQRALNRLPEYLNCLPQAKRKETQVVAVKSHLLGRLWYGLGWASCYQMPGLAKLQAFYTTSLATLLPSDTPPNDTTIFERTGFPPWPELLEEFQIRQRRSLWTSSVPWTRPETDPRRNANFPDTKMKQFIFHLHEAQYCHLFHPDHVPPRGQVQATLPKWLFQLHRRKNHQVVAPIEHMDCGGRTPNPVWN